MVNVYFMVFNCRNSEKCLNAIFLRPITFLFWAKKVLLNFVVVCAIICASIRKKATSKTQKNQLQYQKDILLCSYVTALEFNVFSAKAFFYNALFCILKC